MAINEIKATQEHLEASLVGQLKQQFNVLVQQFDALCAKLDADAGVTDANYQSTLADNVGASIVKNRHE